MTWNTTLYESQHSFVAAFGKDLLSLLNARAGEHILDLGCGTAHLTNEIAAQGSQTLGLDASAEMLAEARRLYPTLRTVQANAADFTMESIGAESRFDAVFSNATLHWIPDAEGVVRSLAKALKPHGRFVAEFGGKGNVAQIRAAARRALQELAQKDVPDRFYFPSPAEYTSLLEKHGFRVEALWHFDRPTPLAGSHGVADWLRMFGGAIFYDISDDLREQAIMRSEELLHGSALHNEAEADNPWTADYVRLRVVARLQ